MFLLLKFFDLWYLPLYNDTTAKINETDLGCASGGPDWNPLSVERSVFIRSALAREDRLARIAENARSRLNPMPEYPLERGS